VFRRGAEAREKEKKSEENPQEEQKSSRRTSKSTVEALAEAQSFSGARKSQGIPEGNYHQLNLQFDGPKDMFPQGYCARSAYVRHRVSERNRRAEERVKSFSAKFLRTGRLPNYFGALAAPSAKNYMNARAVVAKGAETHCFAGRRGKSN